MNLDYIIITYLYVTSKYDVHCSVVYTLYVDYVKKVDKGHYFEFEMPKGCASLSDLIHQMMPNYDPASGYLYRQYVTGESVQPDEKILLFDKVLYC